LKIVGERILMKNGRKLFKQMEDSSKVDIEHFRKFRKGVRNELFYINLSVAICCTISSLSLARSLNPEKRKEF
jgi:hypothetical protein